MSDNSKIEWTSASWNPVTGCTKVSPGCDHCYAETFAERWRGVPGHHFEQGFDVTLRPERLEQPFAWRKPRRIFVNSMSDLFHDAVPDEFIAQVFATMTQASWHTFQLLTKRHGRMRSLLSGDKLWKAVEDIVQCSVRWPLPNVWLGVSVEDQKWADIRIPALCATPAAIRFLSCEPLLGPVKIPFEIEAACPACGGNGYNPCDAACGKAEGPAFGKLHWVIVGGESGPGARPMEPGWARSLVWQCADWEVPVFVKQLGKTLGRELGAGSKGGDWDAWPEDLRVREFPVAADLAGARLTA